MLINKTSGDQEIDPVVSFHVEVETEEAAQQMQSKTSTAAPTDTTIEANSEGGTSTLIASGEETLADSKQETEDFPYFEQPKTVVSEYTDEHIARFADISDISYEEAAKIFEDCDDCSKYFHPQRPALSKPTLQTIHVDSDQLVTPWWELEDKDTEIIEDHLTINVFGE